MGEIATMHGTDGKRVAGLEIGGTKLQWVVGTPTGQVLAQWRRSIDPAQGAAGIRQTIEALLADEGKGTSVGLSQGIRPLDVAAVGVGFGGPVNWRTGRIESSHQISGWKDFALSEWLTALAGVPVLVENDANVAALGEALCGAGRGADPVFWINMGSGVGGGLVYRGQIYHGAVPGEAEVGHLRLDRSGVTLEQRCSGWAVDARIREAIRDQPDSLLAEAIRAQAKGGAEGGESRHLARAIEHGDELARRILETVAGDIAFGLGHVVQLLHPQRIVIGGGLSLVGEPLREAVARALPAFVMDSFQPGPEVVLAGLGELSVPVGALCLAGVALDDIGST